MEVVRDTALAIPFKVICEFSLQMKGIKIWYNSVSAEYM